MRLKGMGTLYGILITAVFMALASAISLSCLSAADASSRAAYAQDISLGEVQTAADLASAYSGDMDRVLELFGGEVRGGVLAVGYDGEMNRTGSDPAYVLELGPAEHDGLFGLCPVRVYDAASGKDVFRVTATWQEQEAAR